MARAQSVEVLPAADPAIDAELDAFFDACPTSFAQQTTAWRDVIVGLGVDAPHFLGCRQGGALVGVLPAYRFEGPLGAVLNSVPQAGPLGGVACLPDVEPTPVYDALLAAYLDLAADTGCALASVMSNPLWPDREHFERGFRPDYVLENACQVLDLKDAFDASGALRTGSSNVARNLRRAESGALVIDDEQSEANVDAWYAIHAARHREIGATPLPRGLFEGALTHAVPRGAARFFFVRLAESGEMVAGGFYVCHGRVIDALMPSVASAHARLGPNFLLAAHSMRWARERGFRHYNWQASPPDGGVYRFKRQWGSRDLDYCYFTRVTGDAGRFLDSTPDAVRAGYPWHYALPFDRIGAGAAAPDGPSTRSVAWRAGEGAGP